MPLLRDKASIAIRDQVILDTVRDNPWSTPRAISEIILAETGGPPARWTGALYIPAWTVYPALCRLERGGLVQRRALTARTILWADIDEPPAVDA